MYILNQLYTNILNNIYIYICIYITLAIYTHTHTHRVMNLTFLLLFHQISITILTLYINLKTWRRLLQPKHSTSTSIRNSSNFWLFCFFDLSAYIYIYMYIYLYLISYTHTRTLRYIDCISYTFAYIYIYIYIYKEHTISFQTFSYGHFIDSTQMKL